MQIRICQSPEEIGKECGKLFADFIRKHPDCVLGLATGASPVPTYNYLRQAFNDGSVSFKDVKSFNLDEYCDLPKSDKNSYYSFMHDNLFNGTDFKEENVHFLDGNAKDREAECKRYDNSIDDAGGIDLQLLGIGNNAHIGFNEPAGNFTDGSFCVKLTDSTINANKIYFEEGQMPHYALTMGINQIMKAKRIVLIATGEKKAEAVRNMVSAKVTPGVPASILQQHEDVVIFLDNAAASLLEK